MIDISTAEKKFKSQPGNSAYPRRMLLRLLVQATIDGIWSSRKIDKLAHENVIYMYLAGNEKPDFRTICNFRGDNKELIEEEDCFICPNGEVLTRKGEYEYNGKIQYHYYRANCKECPFKVDCVGKAITKQIISDDHEAERTHNLIIIWGKLKENSKLYAEFMQYCGFSGGISS